MWLGKSDLTDKHLVRTDDGVVKARSARRLAGHSWSEKNLKSVTETPQKPKSTTTDDAADPRAVPELHEHENQDEEANDNDGEDGEVMNVDEDLLNVVNTLTKDETVPETNPNEGHEMPKLTVLDDHEEMMKGRQKELNSLTEMGAMTVAKRSDAVGEREIQTRWVDREKEGRLKSRLVGAHTARDVFTNTVDTH